MTYMIVSYSDWSGLEISRHAFHAENGRQVVGLMKTIMDNFHPVHVDILKDGSQDEPLDETTKELMHDKELMINPLEEVSV